MERNGTTKNYMRIYIRTLTGHAHIRWHRKRRGRSRGGSYEKHVSAWRRWPFNWSCTFGPGFSNPQPLCPDSSLSPLCHSILSPESETSLDQTEELAKGLYVAFQSFSQPKLSSPFQHPGYLLLPLALNHLRDAEEYLPTIALPVDAALLSLSFSPIGFFRADAHPASITHTEEPAVFATTLTLLLVIVLSL